MIGIWWYFLYYGGIALACYLLGCFNGAVIVSKYILRDDVRNLSLIHISEPTRPY